MAVRPVSIAKKLAGVFEHQHGSTVVLEVREIADGPGAPVAGLTRVASNRDEGTLQDLRAMLQREAEIRGYCWVQAA